MQSNDDSASVAISATVLGSAIVEIANKQLDLLDVPRSNGGEGTAN